MFLSYSQREIFLLSFFKVVGNTARHDIEYLKHFHGFGLERLVDRQDDAITKIEPSLFWLLPKSNCIYFGQM